MNPKYTIAIPAYKSIFLSECIQSILDQTVQDFQLIILNDASPNPIKEIVLKFTDNRISYLENEKNVGGINLVKNWNKCLNEAKGEFVMIMGDDDVLHSDYLEAFDSLIKTNKDLDVFHCRSLIIDEDSEPIEYSEPWPEFETVYQNIWLRMNGNRQSFISDFVYRRSALESLGGFQDLPYAWGSDDLTAFYAIGKKGIAHTNKPVFYYRKSRYTITATGGIDEKMNATVLFEQAIKNNILKEIPEETEEKIMYNTVLNNWDRWMQRKRVYWLAKSFLQCNVITLLSWIWKRKRYDMSFMAYVSAVAIYLKYKFIYKQ